MGISRRLREKYPNIKVIGVEPPPGDNIQGLKCLGDNLPPFWDSSLIDEKARISSKEAEISVLNVLDKDGIFAGQSSGAVIAQAIQTSYDINEGNIVAVLADGGWKYLSMDFWTK
jgi:cysteine synthase